MQWKCLLKYEGVEGSRVLKMSSKGGMEFLEKEIMNCAS